MPRDKKEDWFRTAYPDCLQPLCLYLRRFVASAEAAEDVAHDAFLRVYTAPDFEQIQSPRGYLFRTARNLALNVSNQHGVARTDPVEKIAHLADEDASLERQAMKTEEFNILCVAIGRLTEQRRQVLTLRVFYELSCQEIADQLGICTRTVLRDLARALEAVHAARESIESDKAGIYAQVIALRRAEEPST
jgi:RNA polymerase sigma-70 factor (ECF subfamily)